MENKSDCERERITATEANRTFSDLLDKIEAGRSFVVCRHGRDVCEITPPAPQARRASDCLAILRGRAAVTLDEGFGDDLLKVISDEPTEERPSRDS